MTGAELGPGEGPPVARSRSSLGHALKKLMLLRVRDTEQSLAVKAIARRIRVSPASVYAYLSGATLPPVERLDDLLSYLEVSGPERRWFQDLRDDTGLRFPARPKPRSPEALADSGPPLIEIALPDGTVRVADIDDAASAPQEELDLSGDYVIEELSEHVQVSAERTFPGSTTGAGSGR